MKEQVDLRFRVLIGIRPFQEGDQKAWTELVNRVSPSHVQRTLRDIETVTKDLRFLRDATFLAFDGASPVGIVACFRLGHEGFYRIRDFTVLPVYHQSDLPRRLLDSLLEYLKTVRAVKLEAEVWNMEPYVSLTMAYWFSPVRRVLHLAWNLEDLEVALPVSPHVEVREGTTGESSKLANLFHDGLSPYWDWWIEDHGGSEKVRLRTRRWIEETIVQEGACLVARLEGLDVGFAGIYPKEDTEQSRLMGVYVLPAYRRRKVASTLLQHVFDWCRKRQVADIHVWTQSFLNEKAPGAALYLRSGARILEERLMLEKKL